MPRRRFSVYIRHPERHTLLRQDDTLGTLRPSGVCPLMSNIDNIRYRLQPRFRGKICMNVSLTPELERLVNEKVESGLYQTASEVVREALRLLKEHDHAREQLRADVQAGFDQLARGEGRRYDRTSGGQLAERIKSRGRVARAKKS